jgi:ATP/ADP translocase
MHRKAYVELRCQWVIEAWLHSERNPWTPSHEHRAYNCIQIWGQIIPQFCVFIILFILKKKLEKHKLKNDMVESPKLDKPPQSNWIWSNRMEIQMIEQSKFFVCLFVKKPRTHGCLRAPSVNLSTSDGEGTRN